jgi:hypothetical protein
MKVDELAKRIGAKLLTGPLPERAEIDRVYAGDRMSDLLNEVTDSTLLVTNLSNTGLMRFIELMDAPSVCLLNAVEPESAILEAARIHGAALMISPFGMFETCGRLYKALGIE